MDSKKDNKKTGAEGEQAAFDEYVKRGLECKARNYRVGKIGEIDLVFYDKNNDELIVCEVKRRKNTDFAPPSAAVNLKKQMKIRTVTQIFIQNNPVFEKSNVRFDVAEVDEALGVNILENAF